jgi:DNA-binding transcriptional MerR regulator/effector-binding domain-containing protein
MRTRLAIGDFSRMTLLSVKALRHYHDVGLLVPAEVDPASGYRFYQPSQVGDAQVIRRLRDLGMPLDEVKQVLATADVETRHTVIAAHLRRMEGELAAAQATVASLRSLLDGPTSPVTVEHRSVSATLAVGITDRVSAADLDEWWDGAFRELGQGGPRGALYPADFFQLGTGDVIAYIPVAEAVPTRGRVRVIEVPAADLAVAVHAGGLGDVDRTYGALGVYVAEREIGLDGPIREHYLVSALDTADESRHRTEVCWPVFRVA